MPHEKRLLYTVIFWLHGCFLTAENNAVKQLVTWIFDIHAVGYEYFSKAADKVTSKVVLEC